MTYKPNTPIRDFLPPYDQGDLPILDALHAHVGLEDEWKMSDERAKIEKSIPTFQNYERITFPLTYQYTDGNLGDQPSRFYLCYTCHSLTDNPLRHTNWHDEQDKNVDSIEELYQQSVEAMRQYAPELSGEADLNDVATLLAGRVAKQYGLKFETVKDLFKGGWYIHEWHPNTGKHPIFSKEQ